MGTVEFTMDKVFDSYKTHVDTACGFRIDSMREYFLHVLDGADDYLSFQNSQIIDKYHQLTNVPHFLHCYDLIDDLTYKQMVDYAEDNFYQRCRTSLQSFYSQLKELEV